jgi:uncharacterized pyridoxal phosphate-containing UPF0001 family protein
MMRRVLVQIQRMLAQLEAREEIQSQVQQELGERQRELFLRAHAVFESIRAAGIAGVELDTLSLGMSADLEAAISAGSTMVRVGTAIFGGRARKPA